MLADQSLDVCSEREHPGDVRSGRRFVLPQGNDGRFREHADAIEVAVRPRVERVLRIPNPLIHGVALDERVSGLPLVGQQTAKDEQRIGPLRAGGGLREPEDRPVVDALRPRRRACFQGLVEDDVGISHFEQVLGAGLRQQQQERAERAHHMQSLDRVCAHGQNPTFRRKVQRVGGGAVWKLLTIPVAPSK